MNRPRQTWVHWHVDGEVCHNCALAFHWDIGNGGTPSSSNTAQIAPFHSRRGTPCSTTPLSHWLILYEWSLTIKGNAGSWWIHVCMHLENIESYWNWQKCYPTRQLLKGHESCTSLQGIHHKMYCHKLLGPKSSYIYFLDPECCFLHGWCFIMSILMITK